MTTSDTSTRRADSGDEGRMPLIEHLRELRGRLIKALIAIAVGTTLAWFFYDPLFSILQHPLNPVIAYGREHGRIVTLNFANITSPFMTRLKISFFAGLILSSPLWIYQIWRFVTPGLQRNERRWAMTFVAVTVPLFALGVLLGYVMLPKGLQLLLIGFAPPGATNIITVDQYLSFVTAIVLIFGISFLVPVFIVGLNMVGLLRADTMKRGWRWVVMAVFVFAAVATPSQDPWTMLALAMPMLVLIFVAIWICGINDKRRDRALPDYGDLSDDEASVIDAPTTVDDADGEPRDTDDWT